MRRLLNSLYLFSGGLAATLIAAIVVVVFMQVCLNVIDKIAALLFGQAIGMTIPSYSDFTGFFLAAASFLALAYTLRGGGHIRVTLFTGMLREKTQRILEYVVICICGAMTAFATYYMFSLVHESFEFNDLSAGMIAVPIWIPQLPVAIGLAILSIAFIDELFTLIRGNAPSYEGKGENLLSEVEEIK
jgi:TRAP-type C4-dicarboxylate transport system permease small subunit